MRQSGHRSHHCPRPLMDGIWIHSGSADPWNFTYPFSMQELSAYDEPVSLWQYRQLLHCQDELEVLSLTSYLLASMRADRIAFQRIAYLATGASAFCKGHFALQSAGLFNFRSMDRIRCVYSPHFPLSMVCEATPVTCVEIVGRALRSEYTPAFRDRLTNSCTV